MAQTRKSTKKTSTKKKASSTKKKTTTKKAASKPAVGAKTSTGKSAPRKKTAAKSTATKARKSTATAQPKELPELDLVRGLADVLKEYGLEELVYDTTDLTITLKSPRLLASDPAAVAAASAANSAVQAVNVPAINAAPMLIASPPPAPPPDPDKFLERSGAESDEEHEVIKSPFVGTFYRRPGPDADPYVTLGMRVSKGQVLCIVEAMKLMNEIESDISGRIADILVEDAQPVEYGQALFKITYS